MTPSTYIDPDTAWRFDYEAVPGSGLVLSNISHGFYRLARDMRVVAVWVAETAPGDPANPVPPRKLRLGSASLPLQTSPVIVKMPPLPADFGFYRMLTGISATYEGALDQGSTLNVRQDFEFAPYGKDPPHEPGGVLNAARHLPLLTFRHTATDGKPIRYLRIDYRLNHALDVFDPSPTVLPAGPPSINQAGVFRDSESLPFPIQGGYFGPRTAQIQDIFQAAEKPLQYEIVGKALVHGVPMIGQSESTWDNIHQWPETGGVLPSTPGAFHCCHTHWRWGAVSGAPLNWYRKHFVPGAGAQFQGLHWTSSRGGPLLDHRLPDQSITFAVTTDSDPSRAPDFDGSTHPFADRFTGLPAPISAGANLVQWFCIEIFRDPTDSAQVWEGTVFIHGLYFGHSAEPGGLQAFLAFLTAPLLNPKPTQTWQRGAA